MNAAHSKKQIKPEHRSHHLGRQQGVLQLPRLRRHLHDRVALRVPRVAFSAAAEAARVKACPSQEESCKWLRHLRCAHVCAAIH